MSKLYGSHVPLSQLQRLLLAGGSGLAAILNPARGDMVAAMGETTAVPAVLDNIRRRMEQDDTGRLLLQRQPRITEESIGRTRLRQLAEGTLGREYARFLDQLKTSPDERPPVKYVDDETLLYVMRRYRETHDLTHVVLQQPTNMLGEVTVKYFEALQLGLPMAVLGAVFGGARLLPNHRRELLSRRLPWVAEQASLARLFICVPWETLMDTPLRELQRQLNVTPLHEWGESCSP